MNTLFRRDDKQVKPEPAIAHVAVAARRATGYRDAMTLLTIPAFGGPRVFHVAVESPRGSALKLKYEARWLATSIAEAVDGH